jgi:hypothetical protein
MFIIHIFFKIVFLEKRQSETHSFNELFFISAVLDLRHQQCRRHCMTRISAVSDTADFFVENLVSRSGVPGISDTIDSCLLLKICKFANQFDNNLGTTSISFHGPYMAENQRPKILFHCTFEMTNL